MHPSYKFPRSLGSLDLTDPSTVPASAGPSSSQSHPALLVTDSSGQAQATGLSDAQYLAKFTSATNALLEGPATPGLASLNPAHLSASLFPSKTLSRISENSESAYSSGSRSRDSRDPPSSPSRSEVSRASSPGASPIDPAFGSTPSSFSFPAPPANSGSAHHSTRAPPLVSVTTPTSPQPVPSQRFMVTNPDPASPMLSPPSSHGFAPPVTRHHLPSRPLTTPLPLANPSPVPVPLDNFAAPPAADRAESPQWSAHSHGSDAREYMVQLPGRAVLPDGGAGGGAAQQRYSRHGPEDSQASTVWATAEDEKFFGVGTTGVDVYADAYDAASLEGSGEHAGSSNRFTLDDEKIGVGRDLQRRKGSDATTATGTQGWEPEQEQPRRGANRRLLWGFLVLLAIGVGVGVGVGVGKKHADERRTNDALAPASVASSWSSSSASSTASTSALRSIIRPSATSATATPTAPTTYSTTFAYEQGGRTTVVPLTYTIPTSYLTRADGRYQFTESVVLPDLGVAGGSFTSDLRFRVAPTATAAAAREKREVSASARKRAREWDRREREKRARIIR